MIARALAIVLALGLALVVSGCNGTTGKDQGDAGSQSDPKLRNFWTDDCDVTVTPGVPINGVGQFVAAYSPLTGARGSAETLIDLSGLKYDNHKNMGPMKLTIKDSKGTFTDIDLYPSKWPNRKPHWPKYSLKVVQTGSRSAKVTLLKNGVPVTTLTPDTTRRYLPNNYAPLVRVVPDENVRGKAELQITVDKDPDPNPRGNGVQSTLFLYLR